MGGVGVKFSGICWRFGNYFAWKDWRIGFGLLGYFRRVYGPGLRHCIAFGWCLLSAQNHVSACRDTLWRGVSGFVDMKSKHWLILAPCYVI
jgi:hypothetical protein